MHCRGKVKEVNINILKKCSSPQMPVLSLSKYAKFAKELSPGALIIAEFKLKIV
jgi:hypothetical protein